MTLLTVSGYRTFILVSCAELLGRDPAAAHRVQDEFSEVITCLVYGEVFRRQAGHSLEEMLNWLENDLNEALNRVAPEGHFWEVVNGRPQYVAHID